MSHVVLANQPPPPAAGSYFFVVIHRLTRAMKKAGWKVLASSDGTNPKDTSANPLNDKWGGGVAVGSGSTASITTKTGVDLMTITGLTGLSMAAFGGSAGGSEGDFLTISGAASGGNNVTAQIVQVLSATSCVIRNAAGVASDANNGAISWTRRDPTLDYTNDITGGTIALANGAWIVLQGPSTLKIPFTAAPTGTFLRGEKITQATTNAEGEVVGCTFDPSTGAGWLVVMPRMTGSGAGQRGWDQNGSASYAITGASSGASVNPSGTIDEFVREFVFWKGSGYATGSAYHACVSALTENTQRFSYVAANVAAVTATVAPGGGGTGNALANFSSVGIYAMQGLLGGNSPTYWHNVTSEYNVNTGIMHVIAANAIERSGLSADGSWFFAWNLIAFGLDAYEGQFYQRLDDSEDGDVDPYVWWMPTYQPHCFASYNTGYLKNGDAGLGTTDFNWTLTSYNNRVTRGAWKTTFRRGLSGEATQYVTPACLRAGWWNNEYTGIVKAVWGNNLTNPETTAATATRTLVREPIWLVNGNTNLKNRKGTLRWLYYADTGMCLDTWDNKKWIQFRTASVDTGGGGLALIVGPWDQTTTPIAAPYMT